MSTMQALLWISAAGAPIVTIAALTLTHGHNARMTALRRRRIDSLAALSIAPTVVLAAVGPAAGTVSLPWLLLGTELEVDRIGRPLLLVAALLYSTAVITVHSRSFPRQHVLIAFLLACFVGNAGVFVAADVVTFYLSFSVMSIAAFGVIVHSGSAPARRAGRIYLSLTILGEMMILVALVLIAEAGGLLIADAPAAVASSGNRTVIVALVLSGFAIKAGIVPMHVWLPLAHPAAPPPASAVLSGAMVKAGLVGWLRFLPLGEVAMPAWGLALVIFALLGAFAALPVGVLQRDPKVPLAYSTIGQMGFLAVLVGVALATPELAAACILAAVVYAVHHAMAKGGLFLSVSIWKTHGGGRLKWPVIGVMTLLGLAVAGAPLGSGAIAKYAAKDAITPASLGGFDLISLLPWVGTVSTLLVLRAGYLLLTGPVAAPRHADPALWAWFLLSVGGVAVTWLLAERWAPLLSVPELDAVTLWEALWPILVGVIVAAAALMLARRRPSGDRLFHPDGTIVPPGDIIVPLEHALAAAHARTVAVSTEGVTRRLSTVVRRVGTLAGASTDSVERKLSVWSASGIAVLAVLSVTVAAAVLS
ncbi:proton-conducting transporter membrane subunit [Rhodococcus sp. 14-2470-1a]|uniref:proton-conducting transporter transmembrane domain-containing protein n=1 Tax=Rhodococcus sp. 14-2470-1a TaxID=2023150 RepID=UPI000B9A55BF|nr:proton-conducting transporter membrane subunit [Rhodococcus sp. 14-2470-1a]OZF41999.1 formate hydrogenlyase [Rhodococcus sp. 14-2470-1a]